MRLGCAECEEHLAERIDGSLSAPLNAAVEAHLAACAACAELARDAGAAMALIEKAALVELPPTLVPRILAEMTTGSSRVLVRAPLAERIFGRWIRPVLQPRFALGLTMAALSIAMFPRLGLPLHWKPAAPDPGRILMVAENRVYRTFDRAVKGYENLALVDGLQNQIDEWRDSTGTDSTGTQDARPNTDSGAAGSGIPQP